jgi:hypothetical protein
MLWPFVPLREGYTVKPTDKIKSVRTAGGYPRERVDLINATYTFNVQFSFSKKSKYEEFQALWKEYRENPQWFDIMLLSDITDPDQKLVNHKAQVIPNSYSLTTFKGSTWIVSMQLEGYPDGNP